MIALLGIAVFAAALLIDYADARRVVAIGELARARATGWAVLQWSAAVFGFVVAVRVTLWLLPCEAAGVAAGTWLAVRPPPLPRARVVPRRGRR